MKENACVAKVRFDSAVYTGNQVLAKTATVSFVAADGNPSTSNKMAMEFLANSRAHFDINDQYNSDLINAYEIIDEEPIDIIPGSPRIDALPISNFGKIVPEIDVEEDDDSIGVGEVYTRDFVTPDGTGVVRVCTNDPEKAEAKLKKLGFQF